MIHQVFCSENSAYSPCIDPTISTETTISWMLPAQNIRLTSLPLILPFKLIPLLATVPPYIDLEPATPSRKLHSGNQRNMETRRLHGIEECTGFGWHDVDVVAVDGEGAFVPADGDLAVDLVFLPSQHWKAEVGASAHFVSLGKVRQTRSEPSCRIWLALPLEDRCCAMSAEFALRFRFRRELSSPLGSPPLLSPIRNPCSTAHWVLTSAKSFFPSRLATVRSTGIASVRSARQSTQSV